VGVVGVVACEGTGVGEYAGFTNVMSTIGTNSIYRRILTFLHFLCPNFLTFWQKRWFQLQVWEVAEVNPFCTTYSILTRTAAMYMRAGLSKSTCMNMGPHCNLTLLYILILLYECTVQLQLSPLSSQPTNNGGRYLGWH
jgi:hypothetical protein